MMKTSTSNKIATWFRSVFYGEIIIFAFGVTICPTAAAFALITGFDNVARNGLLLFFSPPKLAGKWIGVMPDKGLNEEIGENLITLCIWFGSVFVYWLLLGIILGTVFYFIKQNKFSSSQERVVI